MLLQSQLVVFEQCKSRNQSVLVHLHDDVLEVKRQRRGKGKGQKISITDLLSCAEKKVLSV